MSTNITYTPDALSASERRIAMGQRPLVVWLCGLSGSGKTTAAKDAERRLYSLGYKTYLLDGDNVRHGLCSDLEFTDADRRENIRRLAECASLMAGAGLIVFVSAITPTRELQALARDIVSKHAGFSLCYVDTPIDVCRSRDPKGLYRKADAGLIKDFTGVSAPFEAPESAELTLDTSKDDIGGCADVIVRHVLSSQIDVTAAAEKMRAAALEAGKAIMEVYSRDDFDVRLKSDDSPVTAADLAANRIICEAVKDIYDAAVLTEESEDDPTRLLRRWCFVIDPLDGTKEFVSRNGEFTVNIALVFDGHPVIGVVYVPVTGEMYTGINWLGEKTAEKRIMPYDGGEPSAPEKIHVSERDDHLIVMGSRSFSSKELDELLERNKDRIASFTVSGSSLKGCRIAEGKADIYYRFGLTHEWDTAAMQAVVEAAGGILRQIPGQEMTCNRPDTLNRSGFYILNKESSALK